MYSIEGALTIRRSPEEYIGQYGLIYVAEERHIDASGTLHTNTQNRRVLATHRWIANRLANGFRKTGEIPADLEIEQITTIEQAEKYQSTEKKSFEIQRLRRPNLVGELDGIKIPPSADLLGGFARMWKEFRFPTPYVYVLAIGELLSEMEYTPELGWEDKWDTLSGRRTRKGIVTPILFLTKSNEETRGDKTTYRRIW